MSRTAVVCLAALAALVVAPGLASVPVAAHEHILVGTYELIVGWRTEPAIVDLMNGLDLGIQHHLANGSTEWVVGVEGNLTATLRAGSLSVVKALEPQFGRPGWYSFDVIPTAEGNYSVQLVGSLGGTAVNVTVYLDLVGPRSDVEFPPVTDPTTGLQDQIDRLSATNAALQAQVATALALAAVGLAIGVAGIFVGLVAVRRARRGP